MGAAFACLAGCTGAAPVTAPPVDTGPPPTVGVCGSQTVRAGVDATIDWSELTTGPNGDPIATPDSSRLVSGSVVVTAWSAPEALSRCDGRGLSYTEDDATVDTLLPNSGWVSGDYLPDSGATWMTAHFLQGWPADWLVGVLLLPDSRARETTIWVTREDWVEQ